MLSSGFAKIAVLAAVASCTVPAEQFDHTAQSLGFRKQIVTGTVYRHVLFWRDGGPNRTLHVYLGGDGTPLVAGQPAEDPTPRNPLTLRLLARDPGPAVYVGRPCYHGLSNEPECSSDLWTSARYSEVVVGSLAAAIRDAASSIQRDQITLFGYSGGGTLAMLVAERLTETSAVVTIAANLDTDAWAELHGLGELSKSLNPTDRKPLASEVRQHHYFGGRDQNVPPGFADNIETTTSVDVTVIQKFDHVCCWVEVWSEILAAND